LKKQKFLNWLAILISAIGAINWGLIGLIEKGFFAGILGLNFDICRIIYIIIGVAGVWTLFFVLPKTSR
jgi:uncharacterized protein